MHTVPLLHDHLEGAARRLPDKVALVCGGARYTYGELDRRANGLAHALVRRGVERGDRVIVFGENSVHTVVAFWGVLKANAVVSVVNPLTKADKLLYLLDDCRARALITEAHLEPAYASACARARHLGAVLVAGGAPADRLAALPGGADLDAAVSPGPLDHPPPRRAIDCDLASIIYTSGSTGEPKGVMLTHRNMLTASASITALLDNAPDDVILSVLPLSFNYGLYQMIMAFMIGGRLVLERSLTYPVPVLGRMVSEGVTGFPGVPTIFSMLMELKSVRTYDFSRVRYVTNTAAPLTERHVAALREIFPAARIFSMYGLTECKRCTYLPPEDLDRKPGSVGIAIPNTELWLVGDDGRRLGPGETGQLVIRGGTVMRGYWEKPEATAAMLRPGRFPGEQVLYTGDLCRLDEDGYLYFVSRMDDIIKSRGEKVPPKEVELALMNVRGVKEAAVIGVPDAILGEAVKAFVALEDGAALTAQDLQRACQERLESFMVPKEIVLVAALPRTTTGKITKQGLS